MERGPEYRSPAGGVAEVGAGQGRASATGRSAEPEHPQAAEAVTEASAEDELGRGGLDGPTGRTRRCCGSRGQEGVSSCVVAPAPPAAELGVRRRRGATMTDWDRIIADLHNAEEDIDRAVAACEALDKV